MTDPVHIPADRPARQTRDDRRHGDQTLRLLVDRDGGPSAALTQGIVDLAPAAREALHRHPDHPETVHVLSGGGRAEFRGHSRTLDPGDTVYVPAGTLHGFTAGEEGLSMLFTFPADRLADVTYDFADPA